ncbi:MAG TPA: TIM44-like domain-containing protein [Thermoleophilaceae bacterium]|jgi:predicted lipid-binding transport protein (Tim44 family)
MKTRALALTTFLVLALPSQVLAAAGSGSSGYSGGGGGGSYSGGGGSYSGGGSGNGGEGGLGGFLVFVVIVIGIVVWALITTALEQRRIRKRDARVTTASAEAAQDDAYLAAEAVKRDAAKLFKDIQSAWTNRSRDLLATMVGPDLMKEWALRLDDFDKKGWHNVVRVRTEPQVQYVGLVNREDDSQDRVVVRVEATIDDYVEMKGGGRMNANGESDSTKTLEEYWTLARTQHGWMLLSIESDEEGKHHLSSDIVATPWDDTQRLRDESLVEGAVADKVAEGFTVAEVADLDFDGDARAAALDLSLADARFGPDVLEAAARRAVAAWAEAVDGEDRELEAIAEPRAIQELLHPGDPSGRTRLVVRGPRIRAVRITALDAGVQPPAMTIEVDVTGTRYVQNRETAAVVSGSDTAEIAFSERWTMTLSGPDEQPWRLAGVSGTPVA